MKHTNRWRALALLAAATAGHASAQQTATDLPGQVQDRCLVLTCLSQYPQYRLKYELQPSEAYLTVNPGTVLPGGDPTNPAGGWVQTMNLLNLSTQATGGAQQVTTTADSIFPGDSPVRVGHQVIPTLASVTYDYTETVPNSAAALASIALSGGFTWSGPAIKGVTSGGSWSVSDLNVDLKSQVITADIQGASVALNDVALFTIVQTSVVGAFSAPTFVGWAGSQAEYTFSQLAMTDVGYQSLLAVFGSGSILASELRSRQDEGNFGSLSVRVNYAAVPEASTWLMFGLGLAGISLARRKTMARRA